MSAVAIGIDDLNLYGSTLKVSAADLAAARGFSAARLTQWRLGSRSVAPGYEDPITLAVNAARPLLDEHRRDRFGLLLVASESGVDHSKPISSYVHDWLGLTEDCLHAEVKHACFGGTASLLFAADWVRGNPGRKALVLTTDLSRCAFGHPAELAEGTGATAMVVCERPRVLRLDEARGFASREVYDVARPTATTTVVDAELSLSAYLDLAESAWQNYSSKPGAASYDELDYLACHTPLVPLVAQAHSLFAEDSRDDVSHSAQFAAKVEPSLGYCRLIGNTFSGCLYVALAGLVDAAPEHAAGARVGLYSYGSGSCASFFSGRLEPEAKALLRRHGIADQLDRRRGLDVDTYEQLVCEGERSATAEHFTPDVESIGNHFKEFYVGQEMLVLAEITGYYRRYRWS